MRKNRTVYAFFVVTAVLLTACSGLTAPGSSGTSPSAAEINESAERVAVEEIVAASPTESDSSKQPQIDSTPTEPTDPDFKAIEVTGREIEVRANPRVPVPDNLFVNWLLAWDAIRPVYEPEFATADEAPLDDQELVLGVSIDDEAKAYPITVLNRREMVNDEMAGIPTLVSW